MKLLMALRKRPRLTATLGAIILIFIGAAILFGATRTEHIDSFDKCADDGNPITESEPPVCHIGSRYFIGPVTASTPLPESLTNAISPLEFQIMVDADSGGTFPRGQTVIRSMTEWEAYWRNVHGSLASVPPLLPVNFATNNIVAISEGREATAGYSYKVTAVTSGAHGAIVDIVESIPTVTCPVATKPSNRYYIVRTGPLTDPVSYRTSTEYRHCR